MLKLNIIEVGMLVSAVALVLGASIANQDHSKLTYLKYVDAKTRDTCEQYARNSRSHFSVFGADTNELLALESCVKLYAPEEVKRAQAE